MPYFITDRHPDCSAWAVVKEDGELLACHDSEESAIEQMVAVSIAEEMEPGGTYEGDSFRSLRELPDNYRPATSDDVPEGRACGNCRFFNEDMLDAQGRAWCERWDDYVEGGNYCNAWEPREEDRAEPGELAVGDFVRWDSSGGIAQGRIEQIVTEGELNVPDSDFTLNATEEDPAALIRIYRESENDDGEMEWDDTDVLVGHRFSTLTKIDSLVAERTQSEMQANEHRQVDLVPPAYMRAAARQGLRYYEEGLAGDGLTRRTVTEARQMARGDALTPDKWTRIAAWIARHMADLDAPAADPNSDDYPSPGVVAHLLWGSGPSKRAAQRAQRYAEGVIGRLEAENDGRAKGEALKKLETRTNPTNFEVRELDDGGMRFEGYAAIFDSPSEPLPFVERIAKGAFTRSLKSRNDVKMLFNHDAGEVLASTRAGTMQLSEDDRGLRVVADLAPTTRGKDLAISLRRGDIDAMSFGFSVIRDSWNEDGSERTLHSVRLAEVSVVAWPAYTATAGTTTVRGLEKVARSLSVDADALADTLLKVEAGQNISSDEREVLAKVLEELGPQDEKPAESENNLTALAVKKARLKLLEL